MAKNSPKKIKVDKVHSIKLVYGGDGDFIDWIDIMESKGLCLDWVYCGYCSEMYLEIAEFTAVSEDGVKLIEEYKLLVNI